MRIQTNTRPETNTFGRVGAGRSYIQDRQPADDCFESIAWPALKSHVGGEIVNTASLGTAGRSLDIHAGIDFIWTSADGVPDSRRGYGPTPTAGYLKPPTFVRGIAARFQHLDYKTFTIRAIRHSGTQTELDKRLDQTLNNHDHAEIVAGYTAQAYGCKSTGKLLRVAMVKTRDLMMVYRYGVEGRDYYKRRTDNADFICFDWDELPAAYVRSVGCPLWLIRIESAQVSQLEEIAQWLQTEHLPFAQKVKGARCGN